MNSMASLAVVFPLTPGMAEEWGSWGEEILGTRRSEYEAFRRRLGLTAQRVYLQRMSQGDIAIIYLEGNDRHRTFQELRTSQHPFDVWFQKACNCSANTRALGDIGVWSTLFIFFPEGHG